MKKALLVLFSLSLFTAQAQFNQDAPWMKDLNVEQRRNSNPVTFQEIVNAFDSYWETRDPNVKGSGYKPFMRWQNYWQNFVKEDGTLPTAAELWETWEIKQAFQQNMRRVDVSNWQPVGPFSHTNTGSWSSGQGRVNAIAVDPNNPNTYYAGAPAGGFWKSTDSGNTWQTTTDNLPQIGVSGIAIDHSNPNIIYIATGDDDGGDSYCVGVMKSLDGGVTWNNTDLNPGNSPTSMNDIYMHPTNSNTLWVATNNGVYKTTDGGADWRNTNVGGNPNGTGGQNIRDIKIHPSNPDIVYAASSNTFYKSTNGGESFSAVIGQGLPSGVSRYVIDVTPANANVIYVLAADTSNEFLGLYKSTNSGVSFLTVANQASVGNIFESRQTYYDMALAVSDTNEAEAYVGVLNVWKTTNSGNTFNQINNWNAPFAAAYTHADIHLLRFFNGNLFAGTDGGFYKSTNSGVNFTDLTAGMQISQFYKIAVSKQTSTKMIGGLQDNGGHAFNNNQWRNYYGADGMDTAIDPNNSDVYYGFVQFGGGLYISNSAGSSSDNYAGSPDGEQGNWVTPLAMNRDSELFSGYSRLYKLCGTGWQVVSPNFGTNIDKLEIDEINPDNIYVAINNVLQKSTDRGLTFSTVESFSSNISSIEVNNNDNTIVYVTTSGFNGSVFKSSDGGLNFTNITDNLPTVTKNVIKHQSLHSQNPIYLGTNLGVYRRDDSGNWEVFENGLPNVTVTDLEINSYDDKITASTYGRGIWQSDITVETINNDIDLLAIQGMDDTFTCGNTIDGIQIQLKNIGINAVSSVSVDYIVDGVSNNLVWNGNLISGNTILIDLPEIMTTGSGIHTLDVIASIANEDFSTNNFLGKTFYSNSSGIINTVNDFEDAEDDLLVGDDGFCEGYWERGVPTGTILNTANSGTQVYGTNLSGNHADAIKSYLVSPCYDLTNLTSPEISFFMAYRLERDWDIVYVEYSTDSGGSWNILGSASDPNWYNSNTVAGQNNTCYNCPGAQWTGVGDTMQEYTHDLSAFSSETNMTFRIVFHSDQAVNFEGAVVDDFVVRGTLSAEEFTNNSFSIYPNPSNDIFNIKMIGTNSFDYDVIDISGKQIISKQNFNLNSDTYQLDMSAYASGVYFLKLTSNNSSITKKLLLN